MPRERAEVPRALNPQRLPTGYFGVSSILVLRPFRAGNGTRTRDPNLGKVVLYQLSYSRRNTVSGRGDAATTTIDTVRVHTGCRRSAGGPTMEARGIDPLTS